MNFLKLSLARMLTDYGMFVVLMLLCVFFSAVTFTEQAASGPAAAEQLRNDMVKVLDADARVIIASSNQSSDPAFADELERQLRDAGLNNLSSIKGGPKEARQALEKIQSEGGRLDAIACSEAAANWLVFSDLASDFPSIGQPQFFRPKSYRFPNFLKTDRKSVV